MTTTTMYGTTKEPTPQTIHTSPGGISKMLCDAYEQGFQAGRRAGMKEFLQKALDTDNRVSHIVNKCGSKR